TRGSGRPGSRGRLDLHSGCIKDVSATGHRLQRFMVVGITRCRNLIEPPPSPLFSEKVVFRMSVQSDNTFSFDPSTLFGLSPDAAKTAVGNPPPCDPPTDTSQELLAVAAARLYRKLGLAIVGLKPGQKRPTSPRWSSRSWEPEDFTPQFPNVGIQTG